MSVSSVLRQGRLSHAVRSPNPHLTRCSSHPIGPFPSISASLSPFGCRPSSIASTMSGARQESGRSRQTKAPSCSARLVIELACPLSIRRRQRCARTSALISVSSRRGFGVGTGAPPVSRSASGRPTLQPDRDAHGQGVEFESRAPGHYLAASSKGLDAVGGRLLVSRLCDEAAYSAACSVTEMPSGATSIRSISSRRMRACSAW